MIVTPSDGTRGSRVPPWLLLAFFASGGAGLIYEVVWAKIIATILGNSLFAISTVVSAFFGGLALGAWALGPLLSRRSRVRRYALLEVGIALLGVLSVPGLRATLPLFVELHRALAPSFGAFLAIRFALVFLVLLIPTALMGATLPILVAHVEERRFGAGLSRLYSINTLGAVAGTLLAAFVLIPSLGLLRTAITAAVANLAAAALAWARRGEDGRGELATPRSEARANQAAGDLGGVAGGDAVGALAPGTGAPSRPHPAAIMLLVALSGFAALVFEVTWTRILTLVIGSSVLSFAIVLALYLFGIAIGSAAIAKSVARMERPLLRFAELQILLALVVLTHLFVFPMLPDVFLDVIRSRGTTLPIYLAAQAGLAGLILVPPCVILGALFPLAARLLYAGESGRATGVTYAVNTAGTILGSLAAGFAMIPMLGTRGTLLAGAALSLAVGLAALWRAPAPAARRAGVGALAVLAALGLALSAPRWDPRVLTAGVYRPAAAEYLANVASLAGVQGSTLARAVASDSVLFLREGANATVSLHRRVGTDELQLRIGGKVDASKGDVETQILSGVLPMLFARDGARVAVIGHGSGMTLASTLHAGAAAAVAIEIEEAVLEASRYFHEPGEDPLDDPRVRVVLEDGRTHLAVSREWYDVIISEPSNPWIAGNNNLFTRDFYRLVRLRLAPDGVFTQWLQLYELSAETLSSLLAAFRAEFPDAYAFVSFRADLILVAPAPGAVAHLERLGLQEVREDMRRLKLDPPEAIFSYYACPVSELPAELAGGPLNTDDRPRVEYRAPIDLFRIGRRELFDDGSVPLVERIPRSAQLPFLPGVDPRLVDRWRASGLLQQGRISNARDAIGRLRDLGEASAADSLDSLAKVAEVVAYAKEVGVMVARLAGVGRAEEARERLRAGLAESPGDRVLIFHLGLIAMQTGGHGEADSLFALASATGGGPLAPLALNNRGVLAMRRKDIEAAIALFRQSQAIAPGLPGSYIYEARALADRGDRDAARGALERGLAACPGDADLIAWQARLAGP